ncbi:putative aryl-alcohol dehydrogenase aad14 [Naganishia albida]|nr:putative aryl-alcohol dehydrogenase aad14 [Naganishia albida]
MADVFAPAPKPESPLGRWRILSPKAGLRVSPYFLGGMSIGEAWKEFMGSMDKEQSFKLLDAFVEAGGNAIDTANNYQNEESEEWIGDWMQARGNRDQMVIATKFTTSYKAYALGKNEARNHVGNHKKSLYLSVKDSLKKLKTDYIDILYLHWWDHSTSIEEIMQSLHLLVQERKVLYLGISDTPAWIVAAANTYAVERGLTPFVIYQGRWNVMIRDFEREILPMAQHFGMALAPWDVVGGGRLQSKKQLEERKKQGEKLRTFVGGEEQTEQEAKYSEVLSAIADEHQVDSVTTIAIAYVMQKAPYVFPIIGGRKVEHLKANIRALDIKLTDKQIQDIENAQPDWDPGFPHNFIGVRPNSNNGVAAGIVQGQLGYLDYVVDPKPIGH